MNSKTMKKIIENKLREKIRGVIKKKLTEAPYGSKLSDEGYELKLFIDNDSSLYRQKFIPIYKNLTKKAKKDLQLIQK